MTNEAIKATKTQQSIPWKNMKRTSGGADMDYRGNTILNKLLKKKTVNIEKLAEEFRTRAVNKGEIWIQNSLASLAP